ncbi:uncharacterized protein EDB93DRAFT_808538 [Suillus bovinus]|uniref:uncharacterized protein n=1 Tax=Suillus bovinus TaxID=48563 RepID=UPI001B861A75|nr:uncharacterized protein EDB93DRAFT_808538 [Suillus bovinus]KAG2157696.1 hypothetical protein EDB93DRAFT_808538 [Suillus bovinus]
MVYFLVSAVIVDEVVGCFISIGWDSDRVVPACARSVPWPVISPRATLRPIEGHHSGHYLLLCSEDCVLSILIASDSGAYMHSH